MNKTTTANDKLEDEAEEWCTMAELAAPGRCNGMKEAELYAEDAESREHERPAYAKQGIMQY
eukprot:10986799-Alexandrium_andersonii.AAC.1